MRNVYGALLAVLASLVVHGAVVEVSPVNGNTTTLQEYVSQRDSLLSANTIREIAVHDELLAKWLDAQRRIDRKSVV